MECIRNTALVAEVRTMSLIMTGEGEICLSLTAWGTQAGSVGDIWMLAN